MSTTIQFETFRQVKNCTTCGGEIPIGEFVIVWRYGYIDLFCNPACWSDAFREVMQIRYGDTLCQ